MKAAAICTVLLLAACAVPAAAGNQKGEDKTITKVVKLLQDMLKSSKADGDKDYELYAKFKCYCDTNEDEKTASVAELTKTIGLLESSIESLQAENGELSTDVGQLKADMASNEAAREKAAGIRKKDKAAFEALETDLSTAIGQMDEAIKILAAIGADQTMSSGADHKQFMAKKEAMLLRLGGEVKTALKAASIFLEPEQQQHVESLLQGPGFTATYTAQSGQVVGILKDMKSTFETNLETATESEKKDALAHEKYMKTAKEAFDKMKESFEEKQATLGSNDEKLSAKTTQLSTAKKDLASAEEFLEKLADICAIKAKEYEDRKLMRANEEAAIAEAISILNSDEAFETFGTVSATSTGKTKAAASFLQLGRRSASEELRQEVASALTVRGSSSKRLARVLGAVKAGNPFDTVIKEIKSMLTNIEEEGKMDKKNLDWCKDERKENNENLEKRKGEITQLEKDIQELKSSIDDPTQGLKFQISETEASLVQNKAAQVSETKQRTEENVAYQADVKNLVDAEDVLDKAIAVLSKYYDALAKKIQDEDSLLQKKKEDPAPPDTWNTFEGTKADGGKGTDAVSMLKYIRSETNKEQMTAHADEEKAQHEYEDSMTQLKKDEAAAEKSLVDLRKDLATAEENLVAKKEDLKDTEAAKVSIEEYLLKIKPGCDFITTHFDEREKNRGIESKALEKAVKLIKETPAYKTAVEEAKVEGFGDCKDKCVADEAGAECKACMADVTVPAYCAGHKGTPGC